LVIAIAIGTALPERSERPLEAMAMARAVVVTGTPAMADYVVDGETAFTVPPAERRFAGSARGGGP
jgi:glycosyltransferase involved in cell wall biosynthesis